MTLSDEDVPTTIKNNKLRSLSLQHTGCRGGQMLGNLNENTEDRALDRNRANRISQLLIGDGYSQLGQSEETAHSILNIQLKQHVRTGAV